MPEGQISPDPGGEPYPGLDDVFRALAHPKRRAVLQILEDQGELELEELAAAIAGDEQSLSAVKIDLVHAHLPRLADAGIVSYGGDDVCSLADCELALCILETAYAQSSVATSP